MSRIEKLSMAVTAEMGVDLCAAVEGAFEKEELRRLVQEGIDSGLGIEAEAVFARLRSRYGTSDAP